MSIFKRRNRNNTQIKKVPLCEQSYPTQSDLYSVELEEYGGALPIHSVRMSFVLPYSDWCEFEKSNLYKNFEQYLKELKKRDNRHVMKALED